MIGLARTFPIGRCGKLVCEREMIYLAAALVSFCEKGILKSVGEYSCIIPDKEELP